MDEPTYCPTPGWLAMKLYRHGYDLAMCLLAAGFLTASDGPGTLEDGQADACRFYREIAGSDEPDLDLQLFWSTQIRVHPWIDGHLGPLVDWLADCPPVKVPEINKAAALLAEVDIIGAAFNAEGDLLGRVYNELQAIAERRREPFAGTQTAIAVALPHLTGLDNLRKPGSAYADLMCSTAIRAVMTAAALTRIGGDPAQVDWYLADCDENLLALAAVNTVAAEMGPNVHLHYGDGTPNGMFQWLGERKVDMVHMDFAEMLERATGVPQDRDGSIAVLSATKDPATGRERQEVLIDNEEVAAELAASGEWKVSRIRRR